MASICNYKLYNTYHRIGTMTCQIKKFTRIGDSLRIITAIPLPPYLPSQILVKHIIGLSLVVKEQ